MILYGYNLAKEKKFEVDAEIVCERINTDSYFSDDYYVFVSKEDRDFHFNENVNYNNNGGLND